MIALDTNVLVRLIVRDEEVQFKAAQALMARHEIYLPDSVILETAWVLRSGYGLSAKDICAAFRGVFGLENVVLDDPHKIDKVLEWHESGLDFADALHLAKSAHLPELKTFDKDFIKNARGLSECKVSGL